MIDPSYGFALMAFLAVVAVIPLTRIVAAQVGLIDVPGGRKEHDGHVPLIGGLVIFPVFIVVSLLSGQGWAAAWPLYTAILVLLATGVIDERVEIHSRTKFLMQLVAAI